MAENFSQLKWDLESPKKEGQQSISPKEFIFRYLKYLPFVIVSLAIAGGMAYFKLRYSVPLYHVQASMLVQDEEYGNSSSHDPRFQELMVGGQPSNIGNEVQILKSSPVIERVVRALHLETMYYNIGTIKSSLLYPDAPFTLEVQHQADSNGGIDLTVFVLNNRQFALKKDGPKIFFGQPFDAGGNRLVLVRNADQVLNGYSTIQFEVTRNPPRAAAGSFMGGLQISMPAEGTSILTLGFNGENTALGVDIINCLMRVYDSLKIEDKNRISTNTLQFIDAQLGTLQTQLSNVEGKTKGFMVENDAYDVSGQTSVYIQNIQELDKKLAEQQVKMSVLDLLIDYVNDPKNHDRLVPTNLGVEEPVITQFVVQYNQLELQKDANLKTTKADNQLIKGMDASLEKIRSDLWQALHNVRQSYLITVNSLQQQTEENRSRLKGVPGKTMALLNIQRQQKILEDLYSFLLMKRLETAISSAATISNSKVVEPAAASYEPVSPNKKNILTLNLLIGLLVPVGLIALLELLRDKVTSRADIEKRTKAPILGEIGHSDTDQTLVVAHNSRRFVAEQFRIIRSNLQYIVGKKERPVILVTSSFSGEGKSFISTNIGAVLALTGKSTVIMEFDIRKPKIVAGLELKRKMGITNYIIGKASFEELILPVQGVDNLFVIPCGPIPPNPAELLLDSKMDELMREVMNRFEVVIMDTAPVGLVSDANNLAKYADCTLYIVRQGHTFRNQIQLIEELYSEKKLPNISVILNDVKPEGGYYSGSGYYGGYGYYAGYSTKSGYFDEGRPKKSRNIFAWLFPWFNRKQS
jgi:tyrosine-protein kinase Etk/Wzc